VDSGALLGVAITSADASNGAWFYSIDNGSTWLALGAVSDANARLLAPAARLYFRPSADFNGTLATALTFRAWDQTSGVEGNLASAASNGGITAFSAQSDTASLTVNAVNDAPVLDASRSPALAAVDEDAAAPVGPVGTLVSNLIDFAVPAGGLDN